MRGVSRAVVGGGWLWLAACGGEPRPHEPGNEASASTPAAERERAPGTQRALTPWGRRREAEDAAARARDEAEARHAQAEVAREHAEAERNYAELERERAELERERAELEAAARRSSPAASASASVPMSRFEPAPAPMSRPEPEPRLLAAPPMASTLRAEAPLAHQGPRPKLEQTSVKRNAITDTHAWFRDHGLALPVWELPAAGPLHRPMFPADPLPSQVPTAFRGHAITRAIRGPDHAIAIYSKRGGPPGQSVVVRDAFGDALGAVDLSAWPPEQELRWAQQQDGVLFLCTYHMTYASSTGGKNAFITAIALGTGELLWQSEPVVCNTQDFLLRDGWIISGYGFTAEPDFLFVIDAKTGEVVQRKKLASGPEVLVEKGGTLFVRTYDRDYEFAIR